MTRDEVKKILAVMFATYSNFKVDNMTVAVNAWEWALEDYEYRDISLALKDYIHNSGSGFAPSVSQLIAYVQKPKEIELDHSYTEEGEAWALVRKALSNSAYHSLEEFEKLPTLVQKALGSSSILKTMALDADFNEAVESSNFKRQYRNLVEKDKEYQRLPEEQKILIQQRSEGVGRYLEAL